MILAIDAHNIRAGGGVTHLYNLVKHYRADHFDMIYIFCNEELKRQIEGLKKDKVRLLNEQQLERGAVRRFLWSAFVLPKRLKGLKVDVFFSLSGFVPQFLPKGLKIVTMCQNVLPFQFKELIQHSLKKIIIRLLIRKIMLDSFKRADKIIFLTKHGQATIAKLIPGLLDKSTVISHGVDQIFFCEPKNDNLLDKEDVIVLYVSALKFYKHHSNVVEAISMLKQQGSDNLKLKFVGLQDKIVLKQLKKTIKQLEMDDHVELINNIPRPEMHKIYKEASIFIFASTCETFGIPLLEAMASGLPIACSGRPPMSGLLQDAGYYYNPLSSKSIAEVIAYLMEHPEERFELARRAHRLAKKYSWEDCAKKTFDILWQVGSESNKLHN